MSFGAHYAAGRRVPGKGLLEKLADTQILSLDALREAVSDDFSVKSAC
ncbi:hypothetical protein ACWGEU_32480 [Streptomyces goshikiensis]